MFYRDTSDPDFDVDEQVKRIWRGAAFGAARELFRGGHGELGRKAFEAFKTFNLLNNPQ